MIKLIYEKKVNGVRHLFASETGIPAENDVQVTYVPNYSNEPFVYTKSAVGGVRKIAVGASKAQIPADADFEMLAKAGNIDVINNIPVLTMTSAPAPKATRKSRKAVVEEPVAEEEPKADEE